MFGKNKKQMESFIEESKQYLPISEFIENKASNISLGQAQILNILRGTLYEPDIILFDEVFSALDTNNEDRVLLYLDNFYKKRRHYIWVFLK